jgi:hypothetical protein
MLIQVLKDDSDVIFTHLNLHLISQKLMKKHIYLLNRDLIENIIEDDLSNTWIDILAQYANKWINGEEIPIPKSFKEATEK